jgi:hypothetical protein
MGRIVTKNSSTAGTAPSGLVKGELAINVTDGKLYYGDGSITKLLSTSGSGGGTGTVTSVQLTAGTGISLGGTNPITTTGNITITNSDPDQTVTLGSGTGINVTGTYPSFTIASTINSSTFLTTSSFNSYTSSTTSQFAGTASYATTASYISPIFISASIASLGFGTSSFIGTGSISARVDVDSNSLFLIKSGSVEYLKIASNSNTTVASDLFIIKNYTTQIPVLTVSQSVVQFATQSVDPTGTTTAGSIWFTSTNMFIGLE